MDNLPLKVFEFAKHSHQEFAQTIWPQNPSAVHFQFNGKTVYPSYHNQYHIIGVVKASQQFMTALLQNKLDPLGIEKDLKKWNEQEKSAISIKEFQTILEVAFAAHDLGNLTKSAHLLFQDNNPAIDYSNHFELQVGPSEKRSDVLAFELIEHFDQQHSFTADMKKLVGHLILQTIFHPAITNSEVPFWLLIQFIDQVGSYYFTGVPLDQASAGYLKELYVSSNIKERTPFSLKQYLSFLPSRFYQLIPDKSEQQKIVNILDPNQKQKYLLEGFENVPDRLIEHQTNIEDIYKGKFNRTL